MTQSDIAIKVAQINKLDVNKIKSKGIKSLVSFIQSKS